MARYDEDDRTSRRERSPSYSSDSGYDRTRRRSKDRDRRGNDRGRRRGERGRDGATRHRSRSPRRAYGREYTDRWRRDDHYGRKRSYSPDRHRDSRDRRRDRRDYDDIYEDRPSKRRRSNSRSPSPRRRSRQPRSNSRSPFPRRSRQSRIPSPYYKHSRASLPSQEEAFRNNGPVISMWKEFYTRARAIRNKGLEEPVDIFNGSHTTFNAIDETFEKIEKKEPYNFPKDGDPTLHAACEALSHALQEANSTQAEHDTPEIKQALHNLRKAYNEAAESNTVSMRYIDVEPPLSPFSPLNAPHSLRRTLLARSWVKELITEVRNQSIRCRILVVGKPGSGKSVTLVGYLLFYLIAMGVRVILQAEDNTSVVGFIFDADGVRGISRHEAWNYADGKPCLLLVNADDPQTYPLPLLSFCNATIVVTSPNMKTNLCAWRKQVVAKQFVAPPPSCLEVVYLLSKTEQYDSYLVYWIYREWTRDFRCCEEDCNTAISHLKGETLFKWYEEKTQSIKSCARSMLSGVFEASELHQLPDDETNMTIPTDLVTMERRHNGTAKYNILLMTRRIADIVADVQQEENWRFNWGVLNMYFRNPETRVAAGKRFEKMFLEIFQRDPSTVPPCFEMSETDGPHPQSPLTEKATMPWEGLDRQPTLEYISKKELTAVIAAAMDNDSPLVRFLIPCVQNWAAWDTTIIRYAKESGKRVVHVIFLQTTINREQDIYAKGLNQLRDALPAEWKCGEGPDVHYHYVMALLVKDDSLARIPKWRHVLVNSKGREKDSDWRLDNLRQYVMFVPMRDLLKPLSQD